MRRVGLVPVLSVAQDQTAHVLRRLETPVEVDAAATRVHQVADDRICGK